MLQLRGHHVKSWCLFANRLGGLEKVVVPRDIRRILDHGWRAFDFE